MVSFTIAARESCLVKKTSFVHCWTSASIDSSHPWTASPRTNMCGNQANMPAHVSLRDVSNSRRVTCLPMALGRTSFFFLQTHVLRTHAVFISLRFASSVRVAMCDASSLDQGSQNLVISFNSCEKKEICLQFGSFRLEMLFCS